jgi:Predicted membrane protein (DUF2053)
MFTQLAKMLVLATFFPDTEQYNNDGHFNALAELLRCSVDLVDLLGLLFVLSRIPGKGHSKLITAGLGWAAAEVVLSRGLMLWVGARGAEFSWIYIQKCLESNILLIQHLSTATLLWLNSRHDLSRKFVPVVYFLLIATVYKGVWLEGILQMLTSGLWLALALKAMVTCIFGTLTLHIYSGLAQSIGI